MVRNALSVKNSRVIFFLLVTLTVAYVRKTENGILPLYQHTFTHCMYSSYTLSFSLQPETAM